ncbi:hypothetical protein LCGC14_2949490 [marine sediment metagenome]|uniref:Uncharacterized protein n=1 Tax=marine sediment metagenome TaxID=412755 RepID=A0A0F8ZNC2_9ZZZZ
MYEVNPRVSCDVSLYSVASEDSLEICTKILRAAQLDSISFGHLILHPYSLVGKLLCVNANQGGFDVHIANAGSLPIPPTLVVTVVQGLCESSGVPR